MKRFLRYLLLVGCVIMLAVWLLSAFWELRIYHGSQNSISEASLYFGLLQLTWSPNKNAAVEMMTANHLKDGWNISLDEYDPVDIKMLKYRSRMGFGLWFYPHLLPRYAYPNGQIYRIYTPFWNIVLINVLLTTLSWYHPLKAKRRGTDRKGFEVETNTPSVPSREKV